MDWERGKEKKGHREERRGKRRKNEGERGGERNETMDKSDWYEPKRGASEIR